MDTRPRTWDDTTVDRLNTLLAPSAAPLRDTPFDAPASLDDACLGVEGSAPWFWLGTHMPHWLASTNVPLFISRRRLDGRKTFPRALGPWALDSGGFTEVAMRGGWTIDARRYATEVRRYRDEIGNLAWCAPQDWMCEPQAVAATGLAVDDHLRRTVDNFCRLRDLLGDLVIPVVQGWTLRDYDRCLAFYAAAGVDLSAERLVGAGSVCRRGAEMQILAVVAMLGEAGINRVHGFGMKGAGMWIAHHRLSSCDSLAWSYTARRSDHRLERCTHPGKCNNCLAYALQWRQRLITTSHASVQRWRAAASFIWDDALERIARGEPLGEIIALDDQLTLFD